VWGMRGDGKYVQSFCRKIRKLIVDGVDWINMALHRDRRGVRVGVILNPGKYELRPDIKKLYQLRPTVTTSSVSVASRVFNPKHMSCVPRLVRNCISCIER